LNTCELDTPVNLVPESPRMAEFNAEEVAKPLEDIGVGPFNVEFCC